MFIVALDYALRKATRDPKIGFMTQKRQSSRQPAVYIIDADFADDLANYIEQAQLFLFLFLLRLPYSFSFSTSFFVLFFNLQKWFPTAVSIRLSHFWQAASPEDTFLSSLHFILTR